MTQRRPQPFRLSLPDLLAAALLVFLAGCLARHVLLTLPFPYPVEYGEGVVVNWLQRARQGLALYPAMTDASMPWLHNPYGPLWFHLVRWLPETGGGVFLAARLASLLGFALCLAILARLVRRDLPPLAALGACALLGASPLAWRYAVMARVDMLALAFSLGAVWAMEIPRGRRRPSVPSATGARSAPPGGDAPAWLAECVPWGVAGILAAAAILVKPLFLAAALAGMVASSLQGRRPALAFATGLILPLAAASAWLFLAGESGILGHFGAMNRIGVSLALIIRLAAATAGRHPFVLAILAYGLATGDRRSPRWWFALFAVAGLVASAKIGAEAHYYLLPLAAGVLLAGPVMADLFGQRRHGLAAWCLAAQFILYLPMAPQPVFTATYGQEMPAGQSAFTPGEADREIGRLLVGEMAGAANPILADDPGYLLAAGKALAVQPFQYGWLTRRGRLDPAPLLARLAERHFSLVVVRASQPGGPGGSDFPAPVLRAVAEAYELHREIGPYRLFVPRREDHREPEPDAMPSRQGTRLRRNNYFPVAG